MYQVGAEYLEPFLYLSYPVLNFFIYVRSFVGLVSDVNIHAFASDGGKEIPRSLRSIDFTPVNWTQLWKSNETIDLNFILVWSTDMGHFFTYKGRKIAVLRKT
jgi:hypothetical protein